jgi:hypothetical protein
VDDALAGHEVKRQQELRQDHAGIFFRYFNLFF